MDEAGLRSDSWFRDISYIEMAYGGCSSDHKVTKVLATVTNVTGDYIFSCGEGAWKKISNDSLKSEDIHSKVSKDDLRARRHYMKTQMKDGKPIKVWQCGICLKEFRFQYTLVRHIPTHTDVRNYRCPFCTKAFRQLSTLSQHKATHENKRPFSCDICSKSFNRASTLISHKKIHGQTKNHVCFVCHKGFHQKGNLRNHMYTHSNARPYKCEVCGKGFNQKSNLVCHKATHDKIKTYFCEACRDSFSTKRELSGHFTVSPECSAPDDMMDVDLNKQETNNNNHTVCNLINKGNSNVLVECRFVDECNNALTHIPVAQPLEIQLDVENQENLSFFAPQPNNEHTILTILLTRATESMMATYMNDGFLYCLLYRPNSVEPIFCKAIPGDDEMVIVTTSDSPTKLNIFSPLAIIQKYDTRGNVVAFLDSDKNSIPVQVDCDEQANNFDYADYCRLKEARGIIEACKSREPEAIDQSFCVHPGAGSNLNNVSHPSGVYKKIEPDVRVCKIKSTASQAMKKLLVPVFVRDGDQDKVMKDRESAVACERVSLPVEIIDERTLNSKESQNHLVVDVPNGSIRDDVSIKEEELSDQEITGKEAVSDLMDSIFEVDLDDYSSLIEEETGQLTVESWEDELFRPA